jgi:hypothetical protein
MVGLSVVIAMPPWWWIPPQIPLGCFKAIAIGYVRGSPNMPEHRNDVLDRFH